MAGELPKVASGRAHPQRIRPHWWAVLAVSLSLLALVAAAASNHSNGHKNRGLDAASSDQRATGVPPTAPSTSTSTTANAPTQPVSNVTPTTSAPVAKPATTSYGGNVITTPSTTPFTAPTTSTTNTTTPTTVAAPVRPAPQVETGGLEQPDSTAKYSFTGVGSMQVSASWSPTDSLSLSVSCPDGSLTSEGTSSVAVVIPDANGPCNITLKETLVQYDVISYTLTIASAGG
jgi:hypothetical protein